MQHVPPLFKISLLLLCICFNCVANDERNNVFLEPTNDVGISKEFSFGGIELKLSNYKAGQFQTISRITPEISLFTSSQSSTNTQLELIEKSSLTSKHLIKPSFNRYKNTIPTIYKVTLKGYSIMEYSNYQTDTWSLNKSANKAFRKPEIMFSLTKHF